MRYLKTNTATRVTVGPFLDKTDGITPETGLTATNEHATLMVDTGGVPTLVLDADLTASGGNNDFVHVTGDDAGFYDLELTAAQLNYLGRAMLSINYLTDHCPVFHEFMILPANVYDSLVGGSDNLQVDAVQVEGADATDTIRDAVVDDATRIDASALNTLSGHDPGEAIMGATDLGTGAGLTSLASAANLATVDTVVDTIKVTTDKLDDTLEDDSGTYRFTTNALEQAPTGGGLTAEDVADAVWDALVADHQEADSFAVDFVDMHDAVDYANAQLEGLVVDVGHAVGDTGNSTTTAHLPDLEYDDDGIKDMLLMIVAGSKRYSRFITGWVASTKLATFEALPDAPEEGDVYVLLAIRRDDLSVTALEAIEAAVITNAAGADIAADIIAIKAETASIQSDTNDIQTRLPAALTGDGNMKADVLKIEGADPTDTIRDSLVDDATRIDASALNTAAVTTVPAINTKLGTPSDLGSGATVAANLADIEAETDDIGTAGAGLTALASAANLATVDGVVDAIKVTTDKLDDTLEDDSGTYRFTQNALEEAPTGGSAPTAAEIADAVWDEDITDHSDADSAGEALQAAGSAGDPWSTSLPGSYSEGEAGFIVGAALDATVSSRASQTSVDDIPTNSELATALGGLNDVSAVEVWAAADRQLTALDEDNTTIDINATTVGSVAGAVGSVTAGVTVTTNNDKTGYGLADGAITAAKIADGALTAVKFASGAFDAVWSVATRLLTAGTNIVLAKGTGITGLNDLSAAQVNAEADTALADYDAPTRAEATSDKGEILTAVGDVPTNAELATALAAADDAVLAAIAGLSIPTAIQVADALLARDLGSGTNAGTEDERTVRAALRALRNKWAIADGTLTVMKEDDETAAWTAEVTNQAGNPVISIDPTGPA